MVRCLRLRPSGYGGQRVEREGSDRMLLQPFRSDAGHYSLGQRETET